MGERGRDESPGEGGITAAIVGVIANLALYFAEHTLFAAVHDRTFGPLHLGLPDLATFRPVAFGIALVAVALIFRLRWSVLRTLGVCAQDSAWRRRWRD